MPEIHFICGLPDSGKTKLRNKLASEMDFPIVFDVEERTREKLSTDKIKWTPSIQSECFSLEKADFENALNDKNDIIIERNFLSVKGLEYFFSLLSLIAKYTFHCHFIGAEKTEENYKTLEERMKLRSQNGKNILTSKSLDELLSIMQIPNREEGYDEVRYYDLDGKLTDVAA